MFLLLLQWRSPIGEHVLFVNEVYCFVTFNCVSTPDNQLQDPCNRFQKAYVVPPDDFKFKLEFLRPHYNFKLKSYCPIITSNWSLTPPIHFWPSLTCTISQVAKGQHNFFIKSCWHPIRLTHFLFFFKNFSISVIFCENPWVNKLRFSLY